MTSQKITPLTLPESAKKLIESNALGHVVTLNPDGSPHVTCVWVGIDQDDIAFASMNPWRKTKNLQRDPRVALSIESPQLEANGLPQYLTVRGRADVIEGGAFDLLRTLAQTYIGPGTAFPPQELATKPGYVMRVTSIEEIGGIGPWAGRVPGLPKKRSETS
jgi:PPOX class probable F420-dependent enzyme